MKKIFWAVTLLVALPFVARTQCKEVKWPENKAKAEECVAVFGDAVKQGQYREAVPALRWMLTNAPQWNVKLYIDAVEAYDKLANAEKDPAKKQVLVDSVLLLFDMRIKNCGEEGKVLDRKSHAAVRYNGQNKDKVAEILSLYDRDYELNGANVMDVNLDAYMAMVQANVVMLKSLNEDQIFARYDKISAAIAAKIKAAETKNDQAQVEKLKKIQSSVDDRLGKIAPLDCNQVKKILEPKFKQNPNDIALATKILKYLTKDNCIEDPLWAQVAEVIHKTNPDFGIAKTLAKLQMKNGNVDKAETFANEAATLATKPADKAEAIIFVGDIQAQKGSKATARETYRKALAADPANKEGYEKIGDLYMNSFKECSQQKSLAEDRLVYIAAYEYYARSGNQQKMNQARSQFPSVTELFELNWKEGETKKISCWVGETVTLRTRGKE